jgi:molecular chaperone GrpE
MTEDPNKEETLDQNNPEPESSNPETPPEEAPIEASAPDAAADPAPDDAAEDAAPDDPDSPDGEESPWGSDKPLEAEIADLKDKLLRSLAENENQIRRARRDREDATKYAAANFARDMLGVADNIRRALEAVPEGLNQEDAAVKAFLDGIALTEKEFLIALERHGIKKISPLGEKFDHDHHEALFEVPTSDADPGTVMQVVEEGYIIHDRLLRAARVGVAKALAPPPSDDDGDSHQVDTTA